jgi:hypothetical protein
MGAARRRVRAQDMRRDWSGIFTWKWKWKDMKGVGMGGLVSRFAVGLKWEVLERFGSEENKDAKRDGCSVYISM